MDASNSDIDRLIESLNKLAGSLNKTFAGVDRSGSQPGNSSTARPRDATRTKAIDAADKQFDEVTAAAEKLRVEFKGAASVFSGLSSGFKDAQHHLLGFSKSMAGGAENMLLNLTTTLKGGLIGAFGGVIVGELIEGGQRLIQTYQKMSDVGQTFNGSMLEMAKQAGDAGLPLGEFQRMLTKNSTVAALMAESGGRAGTTLGQLQKNVRDTLKPVGMYGMSLSEITDLTGDYAETMRLTNTSSLKNKEATTAGIDQFAKDISDFSYLTGKDREEVARATEGAMRDVSFAATDLTESQTKAVRSSTAFLAALPGEAGNALSKMLTQTVAYGASYLTDQGKEFASVGASRLNELVQGLADKSMHGRAPSTSENKKFLTDVKQYYNDNKDSLKLQAMAGNSAAAQTLAYLEQMNGLDEKRLGEMQKQQALTKQFSDLQNKLESLSGAFMTGLYTALAPLEDAFSDEDWVKGLQANFTELGSTVGTMIATVFTKQNIDAMVTMIDGVVKSLPYVVAAIGGLIKAFTYMGSVVGSLGGPSGSLHNFMTVLGLASTALGVFFGVKLTKFLLGVGKDMLGFGPTKKEVTINAAGVHINGAAVGGGLNGGTGLGGAAAAAEEAAAITAAKAKPRGFFGRMKDRAVNGRLGKSRLGKLMGLVSGAENAVGAVAGMAGGAADCCCPGGAGGGLGSLAQSGVEAAADLAGKHTGAAKEAAEAAETVGKHTGVAKGAVEAAEAVGKDALEIAEHSGSMVSKLGKVAAMGGSLAGFGAKFLPGVGTVALGVDALQRHRDGDNIGAAADAASGALDFIPGVGSIASLAIQGGLGLRDYVGRKTFDKYTGLSMLGLDDDGPDPASPNTPATPPPSAASDDDPFGGSGATNPTSPTGPNVAAGADAQHNRDMLKAQTTTNDLLLQLLAMNGQTGKAQLDLSRRTARAAETSAASAQQ